MRWDSRWRREETQQRKPEGRTWYLRGQDFIVAYALAERAPCSGARASMTNMWR